MKQFITHSVHIFSYKNCSESNEKYSFNIPKKMLPSYTVVYEPEPVPHQKFSPEPELKLEPHKNVYIS
jgi:hypothetical protein